MRPGLGALRARGPARYYGGEIPAAAHAARGARGAGFRGCPRRHRRRTVHGRAGGARGTGRRRARSVPAGEGPPSFLAPLPAGVLDASEPRGGLLARLGVHTLGGFAALEREARARAVRPAGCPPARPRRGARLPTRAAAHPASRARPRGVVSSRRWSLVDQVAFGIRIAAEEFIAGLGAVDLVCTELRVELDVERGRRFGAGVAAPRLLRRRGGWSTGCAGRCRRWGRDASGATPRRRAAGSPVCGSSPEAVDAASHHQPAMFGAGTDERVHHCALPCAGDAGPWRRAHPAIGGGRWLAERQVLVPWGDRVVPGERSARARGPGALTAPLPGTVVSRPARPVPVTDARGARRSTIDERGALARGARRPRRERAAPARSWRGRGRGRSPSGGGMPSRARRAHRFQVVDADQIGVARRARGRRVEHRGAGTTDGLRTTRPSPGRSWSAPSATHGALHAAGRPRTAATAPRGRASARRTSRLPSSARRTRCPTPSCTPTRRTSASSTAPPRRRSSPRRPSASACTRLALTDHDGFYGIVRFAEAAEARRPADGVRGRSCRSRLPKPQKGDADPDRRTTCSCWPAARRATPRWPRPSAQAQLRGAEKGRPVYDLDELAGAADGHWARAHRVPQGRGAGRRSSMPSGGRRRRARGGRELDRPRRPVRPRQRRRRALGPRRPARLGAATTPWPRWPRAPARRRRHQQRALRHAAARPLATALAAVRARRSLDERRRLAAGAAGACPAVRGRAGTRRFARYPGAVGRPPPSWGGPAPSTCSCVAPVAAAVSTAGVAQRDGVAARTSSRWAAPSALRPRAPPVPDAWRPDRPRARPSSSSSASPATSSSSATSLEFCAAQRHPLPGPRSAANSGGVLRRSASPTPTPFALGLPVRAVPLQARTRRAAGHRRRHRVRPAGGGHPARLREVRPPARRPGRQRHHLPGRSRRCATWPRPSATRPASRTRGRKQVDALGRGGLDVERPTDDIPGPRCWTWPPSRCETFRRHLGIHSGGMVICRPARRRGVPGRVGAHGGPQGPAVGQGRLRAGSGLVKFDLLGLGMLAALARTVDLVARAPRRRGRAGDAPAGGPGGLRHAVPGRLRSGCSRSKSRAADGRRCPRLRPRTLLRPGDRGRPDPPRGRSRAAPVHPYIRRRKRAGAGHLPAPAAGAGAERRPSASRCSRSS